MNLNPAIVIPTYWSSRRSLGTAERNALYDRMTPIDKDGELPKCLASLRGVEGIKHVRVIVLVAAESGVENQAAEKVRALLGQFPDLNTVMVGQPELRYVHRRMEQVGLGALSSCACLQGYGAIRNLGILTASIFGHDTVIFLEGDEVVSGPDFLERAVQGLGAKTPSGAIITAKTGYIKHSGNTFHLPAEKRWYRRSWDKAAGFNSYLDAVMAGPRFSRANLANGGCMVLHADAFGRVSFDPWIMRGDDLDYVISGRMYGLDVWFDNQLFAQTLPTESALGAAHFEQDVYRWFYESRKIEFAKAQIDLLQVDPQGLNPYPGPMLGRNVGRKALVTCLLSVVGDAERGAYWGILTKGRKRASEYARENCSRYFEFQRQWPTLVRALWNCVPLATQLSGARSVQSGNPAFTGRFAAVTVDTEARPE